MKINNKNAKKKNTYFKFKVIAVVFVALIGFGIYGVIKASDYVASRDEAIFNDGVEVGRFLELNEPKDDYTSMDCVNTYGELVHCQTLKTTPILPSSNQGSKDVVLDKLAQIESGNGKVRKILDTNNKYSLGKFHFQAHTVKDLYKRYYGKNITILEAVKIAEDDELSRKLAHDAIFVKGEKFHWKISMCKMGELKKGCLTQKQINNLFAKK